MSKDWEAIVPTPGKLFMVGDPKQSIYRFRRADIVTMAHVRNHLVHESTPLQQNFRSQQSIISWVNHVFSRWMRNEDGSELQAEYRDLVATHGVLKDGEEESPSVYFVGEGVDGTRNPHVGWKGLRWPPWHGESRKSGGRSVARNPEDGEMPPTGTSASCCQAARTLRRWSRRWRPRTCRIASRASPSCWARKTSGSC